MQAKNRLGRDSICDICFLLAWAIAGWLLLQKCRYGYANLDESFYLAIANRFRQGDAMLSADWSLTQLFAFLTFPVMDLYLRMAQGSMEGILLHFRYAYIVLLLLTSAFVFWRCRRRFRWGALFGALLLLLYAPFGISALSYNSLGILFAVLTTVTYAEASARGFWRLLSGCFFAGAVLCCPFLAVLYIPLTLASILARSERRARIRAWLWFTAGAALVAATFIVYILCRASVAEMLQCMPYIFDDAGHRRSTLADRLRDYFRFIYTFYNRRLRVALAILLLLYVVLLIDRKRKQHRTFYLAAATPIFLYLMYYCAVTNGYVNYTVMPLSYFAPLAYALIDRDKAAAKIAMWGSYPFGVLYSFLITCASNNEIYAISSVLIVASFATSLLFGILLREMCGEGTTRNGKRFLRDVGVFCAAGILLIQLAGLSYARYLQVFWESSGMEGQTERIETGIERGILVTPEKKTHNERIHNVAAQLSAIAGDRDDLTLLVAGVEPGLYLMCDAYACGCYNIWPETDDRMLYKLVTYYEMHPEKMPDCVWVDDVDASVPAWLTETCGYQEIAASSGRLLLRDDSFPVVP